MHTTPGLLHVAGTVPPPPAPDAGGPVGLVVSDPEQAQAYLSDFPGGLPTGYYVIRTVADVPKRLGGIVPLTKDWPPGLADALAKACGLKK